MPFPRGAGRSAPASGRNATGRAWALAVLLVAGCQKGDNGNKDGLGPHCEETATVVAVDEATSLGFAADVLLGFATGTFEETFTWVRDGSTTPLTLTVTWTDGEARFIDSEPVYPDDGGEQPAIGLICDDRVEVDVDASVATDDGAFDERWTGPITATEATTAWLHHELDPDDLAGTYDMSLDISEPDYDERSLWVRAEIDASGSTGEIEGQVSGASDCQEGETCTAWAGSVEVGTWGAAE